MTVSVMSDIQKHAEQMREVLDKPEAIDIYILLELIIKGQDESMYPKVNGWVVCTI